MSLSKLNSLQVKSLAKMFSFFIAFIDKLYAVGGNELNSVEVLNPSRRVWSLIAPMNSKRSGVAAVVLHHQLYAIGLS